MRGATRDLPPYWPRVTRGFRGYARRYVGRHFHAVRLARTGFRPRPGSGPTGPILVVMNHPSWWDPMTGLVLGGLWPDRRHFAPFDAAGLAKYRILGRVGGFGIEPGTAAGAREFLRRGLAVMAEPDAALWVTAQGHFTDPRVRPTRLRPGVGHLARRLSSGHAIPLALEYPFWDESTPEVLVRFGPPIPLGGVDRPDPAGAWTGRLREALEAEQDALAGDALSRDPARFETLVTGGAGVGGVYDAWRRLKAVVRGERFVAGHGPSAS